MSGLMRRITRGRAATDDEGTPQATAASEPVDATPDAPQGGVSVPANGAVNPAAAEEDPPTAVLPQGEEPATTPTEADRDLPAGVDPGELAAAPSSARRGRLRHRLRYLRGVRELLLRDIGGFYFEAQRAEDGVEPHQRLLDAKIARLTKLDDETRDLEARLGEAHPETVLRVPGLGGTCPVCGELHGSDARYCSRCGTALGRRGTRAATGRTIGPAPAPAGDESAKQTTASLWGRPKRRDPETGESPSAPAADEPTMAEPAADAPTAAEAAADEPAAEPGEAAPTGSERT
jgi:hypothetical protein